MKKNIIIAGVGGQGILTIASVIDTAAMLEGLNVKQAEVHGMSQRGGDVQSHLRISDSTIYSDLIPEGKADLIIAVEPMEAIRYIQYLAPDGIVVTAKEAFRNISNYPDEALIFNALHGIKSICVDAESIAREAGNARATNIAILGAAAKFTGISHERYNEALQSLFASKGEDVVALNRKAFELGSHLSL